MPPPGAAPRVEEGGAEKAGAEESGEGDAAKEDDGQEESGVLGLLQWVTKPFRTPWSSGESDPNKEHPDYDKEKSKSKEEAETEKRTI